MKMQLKNLFVLFVIIPLLFTAFSCKKETKETKGTSILTVQTVIGDVTIKSGNAVTTPAIGFVIKENSIIKTGKLSIIDIKYKDSGIIRINENSNINIARLFSTENADETIMQMDEGKVFVTVSKLLKDSKLMVKTPTSVAGIRGTAFRVSSDKGVSRVDVLAGKVKVNPVKDDVIIEKIEKIVEPDKAVEIDQKDIVKIVEEKKNIEIVSLQKEEIESIKEEVKYIKIDASLNEETKKEIQDIGIQSRPAEEIKDNKAYEAEVIKQLEKIQIEKEAEIKEKEKAKAQKAALEEEQKKKDEQQTKEQQAREKQAREEKLRLQRLEKERIEKETAARELARQQKQKEEKKKEEDRVKNIPNF